MASLAGKTVFITGASRGIGLAIALRAAREGANIVVAAKTEAPHPRMSGTIHEAAEQVSAAGGQPLAARMDLRSDSDIAMAVDAAAARFGGIDILIHNASALYRGSTEQTDMKRFDLMHMVNVRGPYLLTRLCLPHLRRASNPHVLSIAPLLAVGPLRRFAAGAAFAISKLNLSLMTMGLPPSSRAMALPSIRFGRGSQSGPKETGSSTATGTGDDRVGRR